MLFELAELIIDICIGLWKGRQVRSTGRKADEPVGNDCGEKDVKVGYTFIEKKN